MDMEYSGDEQNARVMLLAVRVLQGAVLDLLGLSPDTLPYPERRPARTREARRWVTSRAEDEFSLHWICSILNVDYEWIRKELGSEVGIRRFNEQQKQRNGDESAIWIRLMPA